MVFKLGFVPCYRDDHGNGNPKEMAINDKIGNGKEWETTCKMGMALIPSGINSHRRADVVSGLCSS